MTDTNKPAKRAPQPRKKVVKTPGTNEPTPLDPALQAPEVNTSDAPVHENTDPKPNYVVHKSQELNEGRVMGNHVLTDKGWIRQDK